MKTKVAMKFIDKNTNVINEVGKEIEISEERFKEITKYGPYLIPVEEPEPEKKDPEPEKKDSETEKTEKEKGKK